MPSPKNIGIFSCCVDDWGGSEELWARSIPWLRKGNTGITLFKKRINFNHPKIQSLADAGVVFKETNPPLSIQKERLLRIFRALRRKFFNASRTYYRDVSLENFHKYLKENRPDLMIIAQGINFDGLIYAQECLHLQIPYIIIVQKAVDFYWPQPHEREYMKACFQQAKIIFFVSHHNKRLTEEQFGIRFTNAKMISNPIKVPVFPLPFADTSSGYKLACVGRLFILDKGQDILLRILSKPIWRSRPIQVSLAGTGVDEVGLKALVQLLKLENIHFSGHITDIKKIWETHHALILPSRSEGLPLTMLEAMAAGRPVIVSNAGGNAEVVENGVTGFVGEACEQSFESAMEHAWQKRFEWEEIGKKASTYILNNLPLYPELLLVDCINKILYEK